MEKICARIRIAMGFLTFAFILFFYVLYFKQFWCVIFFFLILNLSLLISCVQVCAWDHIRSMYNSYFLKIYSPHVQLSVCIDNVLKHVVHCWVSGYNVICVSFFFSFSSEKKLVMFFYHECIFSSFKSNICLWGHICRCLEYYFDFSVSHVLFTFFNHLPIFIFFIIQLSVSPMDPGIIITLSLEIPCKYSAIIIIITTSN